MPLSHATPSSASAASSLAGAAVTDITPAGSVFLFGYPHVPRHSIGVHDPLECAALYLRSGRGAALFLANDLIYLSRDFAAAVRARIAAETNVPAEAVMLTATHTHSGPVTTDNLSNAADSVVPKADPAHLEWLANRMVAAARAAVESAAPAECGLAIARAEGVGSNRHDPAGPTDAEVPVFVARSLATRQPIGCMVVYGMHPTVLHEDSKLVSADFPGFTRRWLRKRALSESCPVLYHQGAAGNQSPRHVTRANTFAEAQRIGENLGHALAAALGTIDYNIISSISARRAMMEVEPRVFPTVESAQSALWKSRAILDRLRAEGASRPSIRTAECDVFGAEKTVVLAQASADGRLAAAVRSASPAEIQVIEIGPWKFAGWPGEFFVEHGLALKARVPGTFLITLANGEMQGYIATPEAIARGAYEATNAIFKVENGPRFVERSLALIGIGSGAPK
ncbi:MAG: neutral/alkaline non-lysosomal ceramidase N-terminal domain-containing protein [Opitutaceae bacterium]